MPQTPLPRHHWPERVKHHVSAYFVIGTDTGVGKTRVSCALLRGLQTQHARCIGMKPVASGCEWVDGADAHGQASGHWRNDDTQQLRAASTFAVPAPYDNPYALPEPVAPHVAARNAGIRIDLDHIEASFHALRQQADAVVVEGAGGFLVPVDDAGNTMADLATRLKLPVVLVVGIRLGCLNHALLTQEAVQRRGLTLAGWVANAVSPDAMPYRQANVDTLKHLMNAPMLADWPWQPGSESEALCL
jgi:dethiobiotin synthetase